MRTAYTLFRKDKDAFDAHLHDDPPNPEAGRTCDTMGIIPEIIYQPSVHLRPNTYIYVHFTPKQSPSIPDVACEDNRDGQVLGASPEGRSESRDLPEHDRSEHLAPSQRRSGECHSRGKPQPVTLITTPADSGGKANEKLQPDSPRPPTQRLVNQDTPSVPIKTEPPPDPPMHNIVIIDDDDDDDKDEDLSMEEDRTAGKHSSRRERDPSQAGNPSDLRTPAGSPRIQFAATNLTQRKAQESVKEAAAKV
jgi:hypothetical protein